MSVFASYFWLWSIVGLLGLVLLSTVGAILKVAGFLAPLGRASVWLDRLPTSVQAVAAFILIAMAGYPALIHHLWAEATADQIRREYDGLPRFPGARAEAPVEQMGGLWDPTGTDGTYIITTYGTGADFPDVMAFYQGALGQRGWVEQSPAQRGARAGAGARLTFRDRADQAQYELMVVRLPVGTREVAQDLAGERTLFSLRLGVVDPRATTQVAWLIDCLVRGAPTFPSCEPAGWHPAEQPQ